MHYTALYGEYDAVYGRRWNLDPKPVHGISPYVTFGDNPIWYSDPLLDTWKTKNDKETAEDVKKEVNVLVSKIDKKIAAIEKARGKVEEEKKDGIEKQINKLQEEKASLNDVITGLDKMEADKEYTYTFIPREYTPGTKDGFIKTLDGELVPGLTTYKVGEGSNYEGKKYSVTISLNHIMPKSIGDFLADNFNRGNMKAIRAHEIIHGLQIALRELLIPSNPASQNGETFENGTKTPGNNFETIPYKTQDAYDKHR